MVTSLALWTQSVSAVFCRRVLLLNLLSVKQHYELWDEWCQTVTFFDIFQIFSIFINKLAFLCQMKRMLVADSCFHSQVVYQQHFLSHEQTYWWSCKTLVTRHWMHFGVNGISAKSFCPEKVNNWTLILICDAFSGIVTLYIMFITGDVILMKLPAGIQN